MKNSKELYNLTKQAFGPKTARITPLRSKDGKEVHNTMEKISNRWKKHYSELLNRKSQVDPAALERIQQRPKVDSLNDLPTLEEVQTSISKLNLGKPFTARQIQEKCSEHRQDLYQVFVDLTKAFDSVNRETLWKILGKLICPDHFVKLIRSFHDEMEVSVNVGGTLTDPFKVETGVKQGDLLAPTLFSVFFSIVLNDAFRD